MEENFLHPYEAKGKYDSLVPLKFYFLDARENDNRFILY
jgi:hypothetical protein